MTPARTVSDREAAGTSVPVPPVVWARPADNTGFPEGLRSRAIARAARTTAAMTAAAIPSTALTAVAA
jgi:hypothetical protein